MQANGLKLLSDSKFFSGYSRWDETKNRYETWDEAVDRVMNMHRQKYAHKMTPVLEEMFQFAEKAYKEKLILGSQRALQFGGEQIFKHESRMYNCSTSHCDRPAFFNEALYLSLSGVGVGFSVQKHHVNKLPQIARRSSKKVKLFTIPDSIEGWSDAIAVLLSSYFVDGGVFPEYKGCQVHFDYTKIRPKGAMISGGFKAPGPDGLRNAIIKIETLLESQLEDNPVTSIRPIVAYDIVMHMSDAVLSGGVRRSATICIFDKDDQEMMKAKTGNWFSTNPQRGRSNNSAMLIRGELTREEWKDIMKSVKDFGEPGFIFSDSREHLYNPCVSGDTLVTVRDHGTYENGELHSNGVVYQIPMKTLVEIYETSDLPPMIVSYDTSTGEICADYLDAAAMTRQNADLLELEIEDGTTIKVTPDHKIWTENRGWIEAKDLTEHDIILKLDI